MSRLVEVGRMARSDVFLGVGLMMVCGCLTCQDVPRLLSLPLDGCVAVGGIQSHKILKGTDIESWCNMMVDYCWELNWPLFDGLDRPKVVNRLPDGVSFFRRNKGLCSVESRKSDSIVAGGFPHCSPNKMTLDEALSTLCDEYGVCWRLESRSIVLYARDENEKHSGG